MKEMKEDIFDKEQRLTIIGELWDFVKIFAKIVVVALLIRAFVFNVTEVEGSSMEPTLNNGERIIVWQLFYTPELFDVVVFEHTDGRFHVKRVLGTPGDHVDYIDGEMLINGALIDESYILDEPSVNGFVFEQICQFEACYVIPEGYFLVLGDNRNNSGDSRRYGLVHQSQIVGRGIFRIAPFSEFGTLD